MAGESEIRPKECYIEVQIACPRCSVRDLIIKLTIAYNGEIAGQSAGLVHCTGCGHFWLDWRASYIIRSVPVDWHAGQYSG